MTVSSLPWDVWRCIFDHIVHVSPLRLVCRNFCALLHDAHELQILIKQVRMEWNMQRNVVSKPFIVQNFFTVHSKNAV